MTVRWAAGRGGGSGGVVSLQLPRPTRLTRRRYIRLVFICFGFFVFYEGFVSGYSVVVFGGSSVSFLPAPGFRSTTSGDPVSVGCSGYHWATSVQAVSSNHLAFEPAMLSPSYTNHRAHGLQLRCLSE